MEFKIDIDNKEINVFLERSLKLKYSYIQIIDHNNIRIKGDLFFTKKRAQNLISRKILWIEKHILRLQKRQLLDNEFFYLGVKQTYDAFEEKITNLDQFYKKKSEEIIPNIVTTYSKQMQLYPKILKFRKNKTRWGSCSGLNSINLNIYLMKLPIEAIHYVVIHELSHIKHKNHSKDFWDLVEKYCSNYKNIGKMIKNF